MLKRIRREPAVVSGLLISIGDALAAGPDWRSVLPAAAGVIIRFFVTPA